MSFWGRFENWLGTLPNHTIRNPSEAGGLVDYMTRYRIVRFLGFKLCVHHMWRSDGDRELHSHPWPFISIPLKTGYYEHRLSGVYRRRPGQFLFLGRSKLHRVELPAGKTSWSLVLMFPRLNHSWMFLVGRRLCPWITFLTERGIPLGQLDS